MKFYTKTHQYYCGIDLHTKTQYLCILNASGEIVLHQNLPARPKAFLNAIKPYREDLIVGVECMFSALSPESLYLLHPCSRPGIG